MLLIDTGIWLKKKISFKREISVVPSKAKKLRFALKTYFSLTISLKTDFIYITSIHWGINTVFAKVNIKETPGIVTFLLKCFETNLGEAVYLLHKELPSKVQYYYVQMYDISSNSIKDPLLLESKSMLFWRNWNELQLTWKRWTDWAKGEKWQFKCSKHHKQMFTDFNECRIYTR